MRAPVRSGALYLRCVYKNRVCFAIRPVKMHVAVCTGSWEMVHLHSHQEHTNSPPARLFTTRRPGLALHPTPQHLKPRGFPLNRPPCPPTPLTRIFKAVTSQSCRLGAFFDRSLYNGSRALQTGSRQTATQYRRCFAIVLQRTLPKSWRCMRSSTGKEITGPGHLLVMRGSPKVSKMQTTELLSSPPDTKFDHSIDHKIKTKQL